MAVCLAKSGNEWIESELIAYGINIVTHPADEFFENPVGDPSLDHIDPTILTSLPGTTTAARVAGTYLDYLNLAVKGSFIHDFAAETLKLLLLPDSKFIVSTRPTLPFTICGDPNRIAPPDACLIHRLTSLVLLIVTIEDKSLPPNRSDPEPRMIANAIAAFQFNNRKRKKRGLEPLELMYFPCITISGTGARPTFYRVLVSETLNNAVVSGQYPGFHTHHVRCYTRLMSGGSWDVGMEDLKYRGLAIKRILAFRQIAQSWWDKMLEGF